MRTVSPALLVAPLLLVGSTTRADTLYVNGACGDDAWTGRSPMCQAPDGPKLNIQSAVFVASPGDTIVVADGVYTGPLNKNLDFGGLAITIRSENGTESCIIDCEEDGRGVQFRFGEGRESVFEGFTLTRGAGTPGGLLRCYNGSSPTIRACIFSATNIGPSGPSNGEGGAIHCIDGAAPLIESCIFENNWATRGGAIYTETDAEIRTCVFTGNSARTDQGGAIFCAGAAPLIVDCDFIANSTGTVGTRQGGACYFRDCQLDMRNCLFDSNSSFEGGALYLTRTTAHIDSSRFLGNSAEGAGGGIQAFLDVALSLTNCSFLGNMAEWGGALSCRSSMTATITNTVLWNDVAVNGAELSIRGGSSARVDYCNVEGGFAWVYIDPGATLDWGVGNIVVPPMFADPENGDLHLLPGSPCIDAGDPLYAAPGLTDMDGEARVWAGRVDMGADEYGSMHFGDMNCDGQIDAFDIEPFILALIDPNTYMTMFPTCDVQLADLNGDGAVDAFDVEPFVSALVGG